MLKMSRARERAERAYGESEESPKRAGDQNGSIVLLSQGCEGKVSGKEIALRQLILGGFQGTAASVVTLQ